MTVVCNTDLKMTCQGLFGWKLAEASCFEAQN